MNIKIAKIKRIKKTCFNCITCDIGKDFVCKGKDPHVFSSGNLNAKVMIVAQNPGKEEVKKKLPLIGPSGKNLNYLLTLAGLEREEVYITNTVKCFTPGNRAPLPAEIKACKNFLKKEIEIIKPEIVLALGNYAVKYFLKKVGVCALHGTVQHSEEFDVDVFITFHPSPMNYNKDITKKFLYDDFAKLRKVLQKYKNNDYKNPKRNKKDKKS